MDSFVELAGITGIILLALFSGFACRSRGWSLASSISFVIASVVTCAAFANFLLWFVLSAVFFALLGH